MFSLKVLKANGETKFVERGEREAYLVATSAYEEGDRVVLEYSGEPKYFMFQADDAMGASLIYVTGNVEIKIPFGELRDGYSPKAFRGELHYIYAREAYDEEIYAYRNQALNVYDNHDNSNSYPHASANVETRGEAVFAARNAIDKAIIYLRADFPHDNWWKEVTLAFSDGSTVAAQLEKMATGQTVTYPKRTVSWVEFKKLIPAETQSPFPALTQLEIYGKITN